jgi:hypothetical protein
VPPRRNEIVGVLRRRLVGGLHLGVLAPGDRLPSVRDVRRELGVAPRVILAAYRTLEREGLVELRTRSGIYVAAEAPDGSAPPERSSGWLADLLLEGLRRGVPPPDLPERLRRHLETLRLHALVLECNADQLYAVSDELARDYGIEPIPLDLASFDDAQPALPRAARLADCVVTTASHASAAERLAERLGVPAIVVSLCDDLLTEVRRLLRHAPVYFVVTDQRFAVKLAATIAADANGANLRILLSGRDDLAQIPPSAPTYLTRLTRAGLAELPLLRRVLPEARVFGTDSAQRVLRFIVTANHATLAASGG